MDSARTHYSHYYTSSGHPQPNYSETRSLPAPATRPQHQPQHPPPSSQYPNRPSSRSPHESTLHNYSSAYKPPQHGAQQRQFDMNSTTSGFATTQPQYRVHSPASASWQPSQGTSGQWQRSYATQPPLEHASHIPITSHPPNYQQSTHAANFTPSNLHLNSRLDYVEASNNNNGTGNNNMQQSSNFPFRDGPDTSQPVTVDPTAVYDMSHEYRRQQALAEAEKRAREEEKARQAKAAAAENKQTSTKPLNLGTSKRAEGSKAPANTASEATESSVTTAHIQAATSMAMLQNSSTAPTQSELEAQMREMFKKMREFNSRDPNMLARLWQQEREDFTKEHENETRKQAQPQNPTTAPGPTQQQTEHSQPQEIQDREPLPKHNKVPGRRKKQTPKKDHKTTKESINRSNTAASIAASNSISPVNSYKSPPQGQNAVVPPLNNSTSGEDPPINIASKNSFVLPEDNKFRVALAISQLLKRDFGGKTIDVDEIFTLLGSNPNYVEFCKKLEARGLVLNRTQFARALMNAIPSLRSRSDRLSVVQIQSPGADPAVQSSTHVSTSEASASHVAGPSSSTTHTLPNSDNSKSKSTPKKKGRHSIEPVNDNIDPSLEGLDAVKQFLDGTGAARPQQPPKAQWKEYKPRKPSKTQSKKSSTPQPPTKFDLARKRTFGELIDMTQHDDSSEDEVSLLGPQAPIATATSSTHIPTPPQTSPESIQTGAGPGDNSVTSGDTNIPSIATQDYSNKVTTLSAPEHPHRTMSSIIQAIDKRKAIRRSVYNPKTIARDVLLACGRHPHMRYLNAHLEPLKNAFPNIVVNESDLSTFRWDIADPGGPDVGANSVVTPVAPALAEAMDADDEDSDKEPEFDDTPATTRQAVGGHAGVNVLPAVSRPPSFKSNGKGLKQHGPGSGQPGSTPQGPSSSAAPGASYREIRAQLEAEARARGEQYVPKRGRPPGWRKSMMKAPAGYTPSQAKAKNSKLSPEPVYQVYKCEWENCSAELHNLATLRKHMFKLHGKADDTGEYVCRWYGCGRAKPITDPTTNSISSKFAFEDFSSKDAWKDHVEKKHLQPIAWKLGDGPKGGVSDNYESEVSESYASDSQGRRVTPRVVVSPQSTRQEPRRLSQLDREAEMEKQAEQNRKRDIGPAMDRQGATLANDERRKGFIDDADAMEIVDDDD